MALVATRAPRLGNLVKAEQLVEHGFCREAVTVNITGGATLSVGSVMGKVTADGKYLQSDAAAIDGSEVAAAVCLENKTIADGVDTEIAVMVRGSAILARDALVYDVAHDAGQKTTVESELEALGILVRTQV